MKIQYDAEADVLHIWFEIIVLWILLSNPVVLLSVMVKTKNL